MVLGPVEYVILSFPGNQFRGEIVPALRDVVDNGIIRIIDIVFATKDSDGNVTVKELGDLDAGTAQALDPVVSDITGMLSGEDIATLSDLLEPNSSGALLLFEHVWAMKLRDAFANANGMLVDGGIIPHEIAEEVAAEVANAA
jgi:hypothetical protein